jgi:hypothetical protein
LSISFSWVVSSSVKPASSWALAVPVLRFYLRRLKLMVGPYFDVTPSDPDPAFAAEAPRHPVFLIVGA